MVVNAVVARTFSIAVATGTCYVCPFDTGRLNTRVHVCMPFFYLNSVEFLLCSHHHVLRVVIISIAIIIANLIQLFGA